MNSFIRNKMEEAKCLNRTKHIVKYVDGNRHIQPFLSCLGSLCYLVRSIYIHDFELVLSDSSANAVT